MLTGVILNLMGVQLMAQTPGWTVANKWEEHRSFDTASDAEAYAARLCTAVYGFEAETRRQLPFHALDEGDTWRVTGARPYGWPLDPLRGPLTVVFDKGTGRVLDMFFTGAPAGWDKAVLQGASQGRAGAKD